ncbi:MAG: hypothetical protein JNM17_35320 [Archangium sp.]|nr:hypothetical protein [Archangium sp.]
MNGIVQVDPSKRSTVTGTVNGDPWGTIDAWSKSSGFNLIEGGGTQNRTYQKGSGFLVAPMKAAISVNGSSLTLQAWVAPTFLARLFALFLIPAEMHVNSGGFKMVIPRNMARKPVNELLAQLGVPQIP